MMPYLGRQTSALAGGQALGRYVVNELSRGLVNTGCNITCDSYFTSFDLAKDLSSKQTTMVGTLHPNKACIPAELQDKRGRDDQSSKFAWNVPSKVMLASYLPKKNKKIVTLLTTQHDQPDVVVEKKCKPEAILFYNDTKGGVDTLDWMDKKYTSR